MKTTLYAIRQHSPCSDGWGKLLRNLGKTHSDGEPLKITTILDSNGLDDALWCLRAVDGHQREIRLFAVDCARSVQHLMTDARSIAAIDVAERYADGLATDDELRAAKCAAWDAGRYSATATATATAADNVAACAATCAAANAASSKASRDIQADLLRLICAEIEQRP